MRLEERHLTWGPSMIDIPVRTLISPVLRILIKVLSHFLMDQLLQIISCVPKRTHYDICANALVL